MKKDSRFRPSLTRTGSTEVFDPGLPPSPSPHPLHSHSVIQNCSTLSSLILSFWHLNRTKWWSVAQRGDANETEAENMWMPTITGFCIENIIFRACEQWAPHIQLCFTDHRASCQSDFWALIFISVILPSPPNNHCSLFSSVAHMAGWTSLTGALHGPTLSPAGVRQIISPYRCPQDRFMN